MKFALLNGQRQEAQPNLSGICQTCDRPMVAKCGERRIWHWAHQVKSACDPWWENETEWHRSWKGQFPEEWQEVIHHNPQNGEKHVADVKTAQDWVLEFQHSYITPEERRSRDAFYSKLVWVVDGMRRNRDKTQLVKAWDEGAPVNSLIRQIASNSCALVKEWTGGRVPVFFDFGDQVLLWLLPNPFGSRTYIAIYPRADFIKTHCDKTEESASKFDKLIKDLDTLVELHESPLSQVAKPTPQPLPGFQRYLTLQNRRRRRL